MKIKDILNLNSIVINLKIENKEILLKKMLELAASSGNITNYDKTLFEIFEREKVLSTGVGKGIALPHAKTKYATSCCMSMAILEDSIEYDSLDGQPVKIVVMLIGLENAVANHLKLLSKLSRLLNNDHFRQNLLDCNTKEEIIDLFSKVEENE